MSDFDLNEYAARKRQLTNPDKAGRKVAKVAGLFVGAWFAWFLFVLAMGAGVVYVIFHFVSKFW